MPSGLYVVLNPFSVRKIYWSCILPGSIEEIPLGLLPLLPFLLQQFVLLLLLLLLQQQSVMLILLHEVQCLLQNTHELYNK